MNDERLVLKFNIVKRNILFYVLASTIILGFYKALFLERVTFYNFGVEIFVLVIAGSTFIVTLVNKNRSDFDERLELLNSKLYNTSFILLTIGSIIIHYISVLMYKVSSDNSIFITSILLLVGIIVLLYSLKKDNLYANYRTIEYDIKSYIKHVFVNGSIYSSIAVFTSIILLVVSGLYNIPTDQLLTTILTLWYSFIVFFIQYLLFALYERNHYQESLLFEQKTPVYLTRNAFMLTGVISLYGFISLVINKIYIIESINRTHSDDFFYNISLLNGLAQFYRINTVILGFITMLIIFSYLRKLIGNHRNLKLLLTFSILNFMFSLIIYLYYLVAPIYFSLYNTNIELMISINKSFNFINIGLRFAYLYIAYLLFKTRIPYYKYYIVFSVIVFIQLPQNVIENHPYFFSGFSLTISFIVYSSLLLFYYKLSKTRFTKKDAKLLEEDN